MPEGMSVKLFGDWGKAQTICGTMAQRFALAHKRALMQEAHFLRAEIVKGIREQAPGGQAFPPIKPTTLAVRKLRGFGGRKSLIVHGDLRNSILVKEQDGQVFVGILRSAKSRDGKDLINIAEELEFGAGPIVVPITPKSSRYYHMALRRAGIDGPGEGGGGEGGVHVAIVRIRPHPFMRPVFEKHGNPEDVRKRFYLRMLEIFQG